MYLLWQYVEHINVYVRIMSHVAYQYHLLL